LVNKSGTGRTYKASVCPFNISKVESSCSPRWISKLATSILRARAY
jgi:hypothetical protein